MYSNLVLSRIGMRALVNIILASLHLQLSRETSFRRSVPFPRLLPPLTSCSSQSKKSIKSALEKQEPRKARSAEPERSSGEETGDARTGCGAAVSHLPQHRKPAESCVVRGKTGHGWRG